MDRPNYASIDIGRSRDSSYDSSKKKTPTRLSQKLKKTFHPSTPEAGFAAFKCQSTFLWFLIITSGCVIQYHELKEYLLINLIN